MNKMVTIQIDEKLHHHIKLAALRRRMKIKEFMDYFVRKGLNLKPRKQS